MKHDPNSLASKLSQFAITDGWVATKNMEYYTRVISTSVKHVVSPEQPDLN